MAADLTRVAEQSNPSLPMALSGAALGAVVLLVIAVSSGRLIGVLPSGPDATGAESAGNSITDRTAQRRMDRLAGKIATLESRFQRQQSDNRMLSDRLASIESGKSLARNDTAILPAKSALPEPKLQAAKKPEASRVAVLQRKLQKMQSENAMLARRFIEGDNQIMTGSIKKPQGRTRPVKQAPVRRQRPAGGKQDAQSASSNSKAPPSRTEVSAMVPAEARQDSDATSRTMFALRLGSYGDLKGLAGIWRRLAERHGTLFAELEPRSLQGRRVDENQQFDLIAGPLGNAAAAAELCAKLKAAGSACEITQFAGERLKAGKF